MNEVFANAQRAQYGQSSEKKTYVLGENQMSLFNEAESCQDNKAEEPTEETFTVKAHARKKKRTIDELAKNLPVEEIVFDLPESQLTCDKCGGTFKLIGKKLIRRELIIIPQSEKILEYYSCTYACAEGDPLWILGPCPAEMAGSHAGWGYCENQQGSCGIPVLQ